MGQALYRKYRSKSLNEVVGQEHITTTLENALKSNKITHAYLFTGPRGVGKTSVARILAHEVNKLPYQEETIHIDIIEIDAASNRRIDEIRDLRDKVHIAPTSAKYKVYIIDEVHMLTKEAFNALLKTLEEPPKHVIFILATTEAHKLPQTIVSRTQRFNFKPIEHAVAISHLVDIANKEGIDIDDEALELIAEHGDGSFRDSIGILDLVASSNKSVTAEYVRTMLGIAPTSAIEQLINIISNQSPQDLVTLLQELNQQGYNAADISKQLCNYLRKSILENNESLDTEDSAYLMEKLLGVQGSLNPDAMLEIVLLEYMLSEHGSGHTTYESPDEIIQPIQQTVEAETSKTTDSVKTKSKKKESVQLTHSDNWNDVLIAIKEKHNTLYSIVRMANAHLNTKTCTLTFMFPFHKRQIEEEKNKDLIISTIKQVTGKDVDLVCRLNKKPYDEIKNYDETDQSDTLDVVTNVFGGGEILEDD